MKEDIIIDRKKLNIFNIMFQLLLMFLFGLIMMRTRTILFISIEWTMVVYVLFIFLIHEVLHGLGFWIIGKAEYRDIKYTFNKKYLVPYCVCKDLILSKNQYIWVMLLPNIILSILTLAIMINSSNLFWAIIMGYVVACGTGDYYMVIKALKYPRETRFQNHKIETGFYVIE